MTESTTTTAPAPALSAPVHDRYAYGRLEDVSAFTRFLWFCAGADAQLLARCPNGDRVKFQGLGGVVLTVGILAFFSGSYAFYAVFSPKDGTALQERATDVPSALLAVFFGLVWALIIFNNDRFIVSSTGKGDGTERITFAKHMAVARLWGATVEPRKAETRGEKASVTRSRNLAGRKP